MKICKARASSLAIRPLIGSAITAAALLLAAGCGHPAADAKESTSSLEGKLVLTGSSTIAPLMSEIAARFEAIHPRVRIDVQTGGSSRGIADATRGVADIGMSSRSLKADEATALHEHVVAYDGVAFAVHASNTVTELTDDQLKAIYTGKVQHWNEVGGTDDPITVVSRAASRSELELVSEYLGIEPSSIVADIVSGENQHALKTVAGDPHAIVYLSLGATEFEIARGAPVRLLDLDGVAATSESLRDGQFPIARPLVLLTQLEADALEHQLIDYARSPAVDDLVAKLAYVPIAR